MLNDVGYELYSQNKADLCGDAGEVITANTLRNECGMVVLRNLYLPYKSGFTEVDMVGICSNGVFVVENKNYSGVVSGSIRDKFWNVDYGLYESKLSNPVLQNALHVRCIKDKIMLSVPVYNTVIFNDKVVALKVRGCAYRLSDFVRKFKLKEWVTISDDVKADVICSLKEYSNMSQEMRQLHVSLLEIRKGVV